MSLLGLVSCIQSSSESIESDQCRYMPVLLPADSIKDRYDKSFELAYVVTLAEHQLSTDLHVKNTGLSSSGPLEFQALFHNYIRAPANEVLITPLQGLSYFDKTESSDELKARAKVESRAAVDVKSSTDSVYENAPGRYEVSWPGDGLQIRTVNLKDVVIWNPQEVLGSKMGDMEAGGWLASYSVVLEINSTHMVVHRERYVCVEPGCVRGFVSLDAGEAWIGQQVLIATGGSSAPSKV